MKKIVKSTRILNTSNEVKCIGECINPNDSFLHPITLQLGKNISNVRICPTELYYMDGKSYTTKRCTDEVEYNALDMQKFMSLPYLNMNLNQMLAIYKINDIDSLIKWLDKCIIDMMPFSFINRIVCIWIKLNYKQLVDNNAIILSIYKKIAKKYWTDINIDKIDVIYPSFIKKWFKNNKVDSFSFNIGIDLYNYIKK